MCADLGGNNPIMAREVTDLPEPDSPTSPKMEFCCRSNETPLMISVLFFFPPKETRRSLTDNSGVLLINSKIIQLASDPQYLMLFDQGFVSKPSEDLGDRDCVTLAVFHDSIQVVFLVINISNLAAIDIFFGRRDPKYMGHQFKRSIVFVIPKFPDVKFLNTNYKPHAFLYSS